MRVNLPEDGCTGCGACYNVCPHAAIKMKESGEGFLYPAIDEETCVGCGLCAKICPVNHPDYSASDKPDFYAAMADDDLRRESSSGAVFPVLAKAVLRSGGAVAGAAFADDVRSVEHVVVDNEKDLLKLKGSKYLQSNTGKCYSEIKKLLQTGKNVLFTGTPCQAAGLRACLQKDYDNLLVVDIICHGVPSPKVFRKYLDESRFDGKLLNVNFRDKKNGWSPYLTTTTTTTTTYSQPAEKNIFMNLFLSNFCLRKSCGNCPFNKIPRQGDLTIGDFWKINDCNPAYNDEKGTSVVLVNTAKGERWLKSAEKDLLLLKKVAPDAALKGNRTLTASYPPNENRDIFFANLDKMSLKENLECCRRGKTDVAIFNFWWSLNYGASLTAYALQQTLTDFGYTSRLVQFVHEWCRKRYRGSFAEDFARRRLKIGKNFENSASLAQLNTLADTFVVGSDQVFRQRYNRLENFYFYLPFVDADKKKIACSASFGTDELEGSNEDKRFMKYALASFDAVSVREDTGVDICQNELARGDAVQIADPVFWLPAEKWESLAAAASVAESDFTLAYVLDESEQTGKIVADFRQKTGTENFVDIGNAAKSTGKSMSPEDWLYYIKNCRAVITDSFHGMCFAIIFNKPFLAVVNKNRGASRFESLLARLELSSRLVADEIEAGKADLFAPVDWQKVNAVLAAESERSRRWLYEALAKPKPPLTPTEAALVLMNKKLCDRDRRISALEEKVAELGKIVLKAGGLKPLRRRCLRYKLLAAFTFGKTRKKYKAKRKECKQKLKQLRQMLKGQ